MSNNIRDIEEDIKGGRRTLAILLGRQKGISALAIAFAVSYLWIVSSCCDRLYQSMDISCVLNGEKTSLSHSRIPKRRCRTAIFANSNEIYRSNKYVIWILAIGWIIN